MLRERSSDIASFVEHPVYSISKMYSVLNLVFWFWFITIYPEFIYKRHLFSQFQVLRERSSTIASFVEHSVYSISKMYSVLILVFWFWFATIYSKSMSKSHFLSWIMFVDLRSVLITRSPCLIYSFILEISIVPSRKQCCYFSPDSPCTFKV